MGLYAAGPAVPGRTMVKFTAEKKWRDEWFSSLTPHGKLVFMYFCDVADCAGYIERNIRLFMYETGLNEDELDYAVKEISLKLAGGEYGTLPPSESHSKPLTIPSASHANPIGIPSVSHTEPMPKGYWLRNYLKNQKYLPLSWTVPAHRGVIKRLREVGYEYPEVYKFLPSNIPESESSRPIPSVSHSYPIPIPLGIGEGIGIGIGEGGTGGKGPDVAHLKLVAHPELRGLTWEMSLIARRSWPGGDYLGVCDKIIDQAVLSSPVTKPGAWLETQYAKLASGIPLKRGGTLTKPAEKPVEKKWDRKSFPGNRVLEGVAEVVTP